MRGKQFREALGARPAAMGIALLTGLVLGGCESVPPVAPHEAPRPSFDFTNGPPAPNLVVLRDPAVPFVSGIFLHWNAAADELNVPNAGNERPLLSFHYLEPLNHPFDGCGDDTSPDETVAWQRVTTPSEVNRILELFKDRESPVSVYAGTAAEFFAADPCTFFSTRLVAEGTTGFTGHGHWKRNGPTLLSGNWQGVLTGVSGGAVRLNEVMQLRWDKDGNFRVLVDNISLHPIGN